jgi:hypothetical protein
MYKRTSSVARLVRFLLSMVRLEVCRLVFDSRFVSYSRKAIRRAKINTESMCALGSLAMFLDSWSRSCLRQRVHRQVRSQELQEQTSHRASPRATAKKIEPTRLICRSSQVVGDSPLSSYAW